jgi:hypothetical protein
MQEITQDIQAPRIDESVGEHSKAPIANTGK